MAIRFFVEQVKFALAKKKILKAWILNVVSEEERNAGDINFIFSSDDYILEINRQYLQHDYHTDVITFPYNEGDVLYGDIFISIDTVRTNAPLYSKDFEEELYRVIIHGVLHLIGYDDNDEDTRKVMRNMENKYLSVLYSKFFIK